MSLNEAMALKFFLDTTFSLKAKCFEGLFKWNKSD